MSKTILLYVDDQLHHRREVSQLLKEHGYDVVEADSVDTAVRAIREITELRLVVSDLELKDERTAVEICKQAGDLIQARDGVFLVVTNANLQVLPGKLRAERLREFGVQIFPRPVPWGEILPILEAARYR